jgi:hypothetical protein
LRHSLLTFRCTVGYPTGLSKSKAHRILIARKQLAIAIEYCPEFRNIVQSGHPHGPIGEFEGDIRDA